MSDDRPSTAPERAAAPPKVASIGPAGMSELGSWLELLAGSGADGDGGLPPVRRADHRVWCHRLARASTADEGWPDLEIVGAVGFELLSDDLAAIGKAIAALPPAQKAHCRRALVGHVYPLVASDWDHAAEGPGGRDPGHLFLGPGERGELWGWYVKNLAAHPPGYGCVYCACASEEGYG